MTISESLLPEFDREAATTRKVLARVPDGNLGWKPHPKSFSTGELASHIVNMTGWCVDTIEKDSYDVAPAGAPPYQPEVLKSQAALLESFDKNVAAARAAIAGASDEHLMKTWSLLAGGQALFSMPRIACLRGFVFNHTIHHRGQLTVYLRLNDIPVPAIYGPSADEAQ